MSEFFDELMQSVVQMDEIVSGERPPSREFTVQEESEARRSEDTEQAGNDG